MHGYGISDSPEARRRRIARDPNRAHHRTTCIWIDGSGHRVEWKEAVSACPIEIVRELVVRGECERHVGEIISRVCEVGLCEAQKGRRVLWISLATFSVIFTIPYTQPLTGHFSLFASYGAMVGRKHKIAAQDLP